MTWNFFYRAERNTQSLKGKTFREYWSVLPAYQLDVELPSETTLEDALATARKNPHCPVHGKH